MNLDKIKQLIDLARETGVNEIEVRKGDETIRIVRNGPVVAPAPVAAAPQTAAPSATAADGEADAAGAVIASPMAGTFYRSPAPGEPPFVEVGDRVEIGDVLCIIESMKMMNRIESDKAGRIREICQQNGHAMETGARLFVIEE